MRKFLILLCLLPTIAFAQFGAGAGAKPTHLAPNYNMPAGKIYIDTSKLVKNRFGFNTYNVPVACTGTAATCDPLSPLQYPNASGASAFRIGCGTSHMAFDDPIVWPGQPGKTHLHSFFGNDTTASGSDLTNMAHVGTSTCNGGIANRTGYWVPTPVYHCPNPDLSGCDGSRNGWPIIYSFNNVYYKNGAAQFAQEMARMQWMPAGFRFIAGNATSTVQQSVDNGGAGGWFACDDATGTPQFRFRLPTYEDVATLNQCHDVEITVFFQQCWDGVNLDSPDHQSHVTPVYINGYDSANHGWITGAGYVSNTGSGHCPNAAEYLAVTGKTAPLTGGFPVLLPGLSYNIHFNVTDPHDMDYIRMSSDLPETTGTVQSGSTNTTVVLDSNASAVDGYYAYGTVAFSGAAHQILSYVGSTRTATLKTALAGAPGTGTTYALRNAGGLTMHGDWVNGWDQTTTFPNGMTVVDAILANCLKNLGDCHNEDLGDLDPAFPKDNSSTHWYRLQNP